MKCVFMGSFRFNDANVTGEVFNKTVMLNLNVGIVTRVNIKH